MHQAVYAREIAGSCQDRDIYLRVLKELEYSTGKLQANVQPSVAKSYCVRGLKGLSGLFLFTERSLGARSCQLSFCE